MPVGHVRDGHAFITGSDVNHIGNVLRMKAGDRIEVIMEEDVQVYLCQITEVLPDEVRCSVMEAETFDAELSSRVFLFQGLPKSDKMELILQKAVELGVSSVIPVRTRNAVVKLDEKKASGKIVRWQGIAEAAAKQSKRRVIPSVQTVVDFREAIKMMQELDVALLPYELQDPDSFRKTRELLSELKAGQSIGILIGPEGGFAEEEIQYAKDAGIRIITLGRRILRTETAGIAVLAWLVYLLEK